MPAPCAGGILQRELWVGTDLWRVDAVQAAYGAREWHRLSVGTGSMGERWYEGYYLLFRRACAQPQKWQAYLVWGPPACDVPGGRQPLAHRVGL